VIGTVLTKAHSVRGGYGYYAQQAAAKRGGLGRLFRRFRHQKAS
jgi:hypothetical protein